VSRSRPCWGRARLVTCRASARSRCNSLFCTPSAGRRGRASRCGGLSRTSTAGDWISFESHARGNSRKRRRGHPSSYAPASDRFAPARPFTECAALTRTEFSAAVLDFNTPADRGRDARGTARAAHDADRSVRADPIALAAPTRVREPSRRASPGALYPYSGASTNGCARPRKGRGP